MIRRLTSLVAAIALVFAVAVPPASACESAMERSDVMVAMAGSGHSMDSATESDCPESSAPTNPAHDSDCLATCAAMIGCSTACFVSAVSPAGSIERESLASNDATQFGLTRSSAPDRPPPRI
jgi:hypothetical protein